MHPYPCNTVGIPLGLLARFVFSNLWSDIFVVGYSLKAIRKALAEQELKKQSAQGAQNLQDRGRGGSQWMVNR